LRPGQSGVETRRATALKITDAAGDPSESRQYITVIPDTYDVNLSGTIRAQSNGMKTTWTRLKESAFWKLKAINYGSGNLTLVIRWAGDSATSGDVIWGSQIACVTPDTDTQDVTTKTLATAQTVTDTHLGTIAKRVMTCTIIITSLDSITANDDLFITIYRDAAAGGDTMTGDAKLIEAELSYSDT